ncbi:MAG: hypothetical protein JNL58_23940 [Planctomyces sp.]|nr:hypothetical protein [Planctomyces sp.]
MNENPKPRATVESPIFALKLAGIIVGSALLLTLALTAGVIGQESVERWNNIITAIVCAVYCNFLPKIFGPPPNTIRDATVTQAMIRVSGWALTLAFLAYAAFWAFAAQETARIGSMVAIATSGVIIFGYSIWKHYMCRRPENR